MEVMPKSALEGHMRMGEVVAHETPGSHLLHVFSFHEPRLREVMLLSSAKRETPFLTCRVVVRMK